MRKTFIIKGKDRGFALIATITLMVLLALLSVGLLTVASSQTRISQRGIFAAEARAQAKLAVEVAIGRLQCELGPDQRISANSGILDTSPDSETIDGVGSPYILGAWDSWGTWANRKNTSGVSLADTYSKGRKELFRSWLISSSLERNVKDIDSGSRDLGQFRNNSGELKVQLLGEGTLGRRADRDKQIFAGLVQVDDANTPVGPVKGAKSVHRKSIAWWISGENQKARANMPKSPQQTDSIAVLQSTWSTPPPDTTQIDGMSSILSSLPQEGSDDYKRKIHSWITRDTMSMLNRSPGGNSVSSAFHDISLDASSLLADVKFGGLKKDINILFSQENLPDAFKTNNSDVGLRPYTSEDGNPVEATRPISSWNQLYEWSNIWDTSGTLRNGQDASSRMQWDGTAPYSLVAADAESSSDMMNNRHTYIRHPILLKMYSFVGLVYNNRDKNYVNPLRNGSIDTLYAVIPIFVWWNPYNVTLRMEGAKGEFWGAHFGEHRFMPMSLSTNDNGTTTNDSKLTEYSESVLSPYNNHAYNNRQLCDFGASFRDKVTVSDQKLEKGKTSILKPGEIVVYTQPIIPENSSYITSVKDGSADAEVDKIPLKESWSQDPYQVRPYGVHIQDGIPYAQLTGGEYQDVPDKRKSNVIFAETSDTKYIDFTPDNVMLPFKYTEEYNPQNRKLGAFVMAAGMMDFDEIKKQGRPQRISKQNGGNGNDPKPFSKMMPAMFNMNWGAWEEKIIDTVLYPQEMWNNSDASDKWAGKGGEARKEATFVAYFGVSAKWGKTPSVGTYPKGKDYRAKTWQHSSPLFWGSQMIKASELGRTYSPYQFEMKQGTNTDTLSIGNVLDNEGTRSSIFGGPGSESISMITAAELPFYPPSSIAGFAGCRLTPGWYSAGDSSTAQVAKRFAYQSGVPGVGLGNSFADPMLPGSSIFSSNPIMEDEKLGDFWDHGQMANDGVWDTWFASSLSSHPSSLSGSGKVALRDVIKSAFDTAVGAENGGNEQNKTPFNNANLVLTLNGESAENAQQELTDQNNGWEKAAKYLRLQGGFNVNSVSYPAWRSVIQGLKDRSILYMDNNGVPRVLESDKNTAYFSRMAVATSKTSHVDDFGAVGVNNGVPVGDNTAWTDLRKVDEGDLDKLAKSMLSQVKKRGPFLNMAEFINRRLTNNDMGVKGALQTAIDESGLNSVFTSMQDKYITPQVNYPFPKAGEGSVYTAAPGYLIQSDILSVLGNVLVTRDDTFTIRAYGEVSDKSGKNILSRAWCEAVVKRDINYVDPTNPPETPAMDLNMQTGDLTENRKLTKINKAFGRQFEIVSFRWLSPEEV